MRPDSASPPRTRESAEGVHEVIDVEAEARPLDVPVAGERAVEAVAEPVDGEADVHQEQQPREPARERVQDAPQAAMATRPSSVR